MSNYWSFYKYQKLFLFLSRSLTYLKQFHYIKSIFHIHKFLIYEKQWEEPK